MRRLIPLLMILAVMFAACATQPHDTATPPVAPATPPQTSGSKAPEPGAIVATVQAKVPPKPEPPRILSAFFTTPQQGRLFLEGGGVMATADGGQTWTPAQFPHAFSEVSFYTELLGLGKAGEAAYRTTDGGTSWAPADTARWPRFPWLGTLQFLDERHAWVSTPDNLLRATTDGGLTWSKGENPCPAGLVRQPFSFVSPDTGWLLCGFQEGAGFMSKRLYRTDDGGQTWRLLGEALRGPQGDPSNCSSGKPIGLTCGDYIGGLQFVDALHGWYVGIRYGDFRTTDDGGLTWHELPSLGRGNSVHFLNSRDGYRIGFIATFDQSALYLTHDGGQTWTQVYPVLRPKAVFYLDAQNLIGYLANQLYRSADGGQSWQPLSALRTGESVLALAYADRQQGWLLTGQDRTRRLYRTADGGSTWQMVVEQADSWVRFERLIAADGQTAYLWDGAHLLSTRDGGATFTALDAPPDQFAGSLDFATPDIGLLARGGHLYTTRDGGKSWQALPPQPRGDVAGAALTPDGRLWTLLPLGGLAAQPLSSSDGGQTWTVYNLAFNQPGDLQRCGLGAICMRSGGDGSVIVSHDGGETWQYR